MRTAESVPVFTEFVEVEADISNWTDPKIRFAEVKNKSEKTRDEEASRLNREKRMCPPTYIWVYENTFFQEGGKSFWSKIFERIERMGIKILLA